MSCGARREAMPAYEMIFWRRTFTLLIIPRHEASSCRCVVRVARRRVREDHIAGGVAAGSTCRAAGRGSQRAARAYESAFVGRARGPRPGHEGRRVDGALSD